MCATPGDQRGPVCDEQTFQYPFNGSNVCNRPSWRPGLAAAQHSFQYPFNGSNVCNFQSGHRAPPAHPAFQYPFNGSNVCNEMELFTGTERPGEPFSIPLTDRMCATLWVLERRWRSVCLSVSL